jgi:hypothetical protein
MPEPRDDQESQATPEADLYHDPAPPTPEPLVSEPPTKDLGSVRTRPGSLGRLISVIVSVGLAWALVIAITAWLLGLFLARG